MEYMLKMFRCVLRVVLRTNMTEFEYKYGKSFITTRPVVVTLLRCKESSDNQHQQMN